MNKSDESIVNEAYKKYMKETAPTINRDRYFINIKESCKKLSEICREISSVSMEDTDDKNNH